jgi:hypothetical protein
MKLSSLLILTAATATGCSSSSQTHQIQTTPADSPATTAPARPTTAEAPHLLPGQPSFSSTDEAVQALYAASTAKNLGEIARIVGLPESDLVTADATKNASLAEYFAKSYDEFHKIVPDPQTPDSRVRIFIGKDNFPIASPLVKPDDRWFFDSAGGKQELITRYIGENELATIGVCRAYVQAQYEYYAEDRNGDDVLEYAQHLGSTKGQRDGLYWHTETTEPESPLGPLVAQARAAGYLKGSARNLEDPKPYHGYLFRILTRQGDSAPGGHHDYVINNHMIAGFALLAQPAKYNVSGIMTFVVGANGKVFQKDLGPQTPTIAGEMLEYNPDSTWSLVTE